MINKITIKFRDKVFITSLVLAVLVAMFFYVNKANDVVSEVPTEVSVYSSDWPLPNQNYANTREAVSSGITTKTVAQLGVGWKLPITGVSEWGAAATNPIILGDEVYFQDLKSNVYKVDLTSGKLLLFKEFNEDNAGPSGVAVGYEKIFAIKGHYEVVAMNKKGEILWTKKLSNNPSVGIDIQPLVYDGKVYVSTVPGVSNEDFYKGGGTGILYALDQNTGEIAWQFNTVDSEDIWGNSKVNSGGGAWYPPAIDVKTGVQYWGIGNPAPWPGTKEFPNGSSRVGKNLYTNSLLALSSKTGSMFWYNQVLEHDLFDYDFQISPVLVTKIVNGISQELIVGAGKMGKVYGFDRVTGKKLWETSVGTHQNDTLTVIPKGKTTVSPGPLGGVETPLAYSEGLVYVPIVNMTVEYTPTELVGTSFNMGAAKGELTALDVVTGKVVWTKVFNSMDVGGATVVNDLVFTSTFDGTIYALDKKTGEIKWQYQASGGINSWPAVKKDTIIFPVGVGKTPELVAFILGGEIKNVTVPKSTGSIPGKGFQQ